MFGVHLAGSPSSSSSISEDNLASILTAKDEDDSD